MKNFHISDVLSVTTGRLVSSRHMQGVHDILDFMTGDTLFTHQLPRAMRECEPWLRAQFPNLMENSAAMAPLLEELDRELAATETKQARETACDRWVEHVRESLGLPEYITVYELGADMHTHIDPIEEAVAMFGKDRVAVVRVGGEEA